MIEVLKWIGLSLTYIAIVSGACYVAALAGKRLDERDAAREAEREAELNREW